MNLKDPTVVKSEDKVQSKRNDLEDETKEIVKPNDQTVVEDEEEVQSKRKIWKIKQSVRRISKIQLLLNMRINYIKYKIKRKF